jgi:hypothetical protein
MFKGMFLVLAFLLVLVWVGAFVILHVAGFLIHLLLVFAVLFLIVHFFTRKKTV